MKNLFKVFKFELFGLLNKKVFKVTTAIFCVAAIVLLSIPAALNTFTPALFDEEIKQEKEHEKRKKYTFALVLNDDRVDEDLLIEKMSPSKLVFLENRDDLNYMIENEDIRAGFVVNNTDDYEYIVKDSSLVDDDKEIFYKTMVEIHRNTSLAEKGIDYKDVEKIYDTDIKEKITVLGKDNMNNYLIAYVLTFGLYFIVMFYGQNTAISVASEKSNRSMEILVTSTSTESLIFGKVLANALAGLIQFGTILLVAFATYRVNFKSLKNTLGSSLDVPVELLLNFFVFGSLGYLLYLFIYSAIGALVSRTEDIGTSSTPITMIYIVAFFTAILGLTYPDNVIIKVASFFPFTSFMAMFVRMSMSSVSLVEIVVSFVILVTTTILVGIASAKIYRLGTLMYGNPVKIGQALKLLKENRTKN